ncbi:MAG: ATP-binding cassette domain-containing protein [Thermodesulfobacteriota bacterium]
MIDVKSLSKSYGEVQALQDVSFTVQAGEVIGLLGPNGAGKTTLMKILTGYLQPSAGTAVVAGRDILAERQAIQALIGYLPENAPLYPELSVQSALKLVADLRGIPAAEQPRLIGAAVKATGLVDRLTRPIGTLSKGYRQRVGLAQAILHQPKILILDEPTNGLDPTQILEVRHLIQRLAQKATVIISTHILSEVEATCDRAIIIMRGQLKADARLADLAATADAVVTVAGAGNGRVQQVLKGLPGVKGVEVAEARQDRVTYRVRGGSDADLCPAIYDAARLHDWRLAQLRPDVRTLEAVFARLATQEGGVTP